MLANTFTGSVVVGSDGSALCTAAVVWAGGWAARRSLDVVVVTAQDHPVVHHEASTNVDGAAVYTVHDDAAPERSTASVHAQAWECVRAHPGVTVRVAAVHDAPADALRQASEVAALTVIGGLHRGGPEPLWGGSVSENVTRTTCGPLAVVPHDLAAEATGPVVVGIDNSRAASLAVDFAVTEAVAAHTSVVALHAYSAVEPDAVVDLSPHAATPLAVGGDPGLLMPASVAGGLVTQDGFVVPIGPDHDDAARRQASALLESLLRPHLETHPGLPVVRALHPQDAVEALAEASTSASLVVVGARDLGLWGRVFHRSTSRQVSLLAACPVLIVPERMLDV